MAEGVLFEQVSNRPAGEVVVVCEKSNQKRAILAAFGPKAFPLIFAMEGHAYRVVSPDEDNPELGSWKSPGVLVPPSREFRWELSKEGEPGQIKKRCETIKALKAAVRTAKWIIISSDVDNEGEWIGWAPLIVDCGLKPDDPRVVRALYKEPVKVSVEKAFAKMLSGRLTFGRALAGRARAEMDLAKGYSETRAATFYLTPKDVPRDTSPLVHGRVKDAVVGMLAGIEFAIRSFVPVDYFGMAAGTGIGGKENALVLKCFPEEKILDRLEAEGLAAALAGRRVRLSVESKLVRTSPDLPLNTAALQQLAGRRLKWSAKKADEIANALYHKGVLTYPRGECRYLNGGPALEAAREFLKFAAQFWPSWKVPGNVGQVGRVFSDRKVKEFPHEAIIPNIFADGGLLAAANGLSGDEARLFEIVAEHTVRAFSPDSEANSTVVRSLVEVGGRRLEFRASGSVMVSPGFREQGSGGDGESEREEGRLPRVEDGTEVLLQPIELIAKRTEPPKRIKAADLSVEMGRADKYVCDPQLKKVMAGAEGVGTGATRGSILEEMYSHGMIENSGGLVTLSERQYEIWLRYRDFDPRVYDPGAAALWETVVGAVEREDMTLRAFHDHVASDIGERIERLRGQAPLPVRLFEERKKVKSSAGGSGGKPRVPRSPGGRKRRAG